MSPAQHSPQPAVLLPPTHMCSPVRAITLTRAPSTPECCFPALILDFPGGKHGPGASTASTTHQLGMLSAHWVSMLQQGLKLVVLRERDYFQDCTKLGKNLQDNICTSDLISSKLISY